MYRLSETTKRNIQKSTGIGFEELKRMDCSEIDKKISRKLNKEIKYPMKKDNRVLGRGSVFISLMRFVFIKDTEKRISRLR